MKNKGITLIALVITIIILLILAGVAISQLTDSGLFGKAKLAKENAKNSQDLENSILGDYENQIATLGNRDYKPISYSTTEQDTGLKWIDGKTIYQKTIDFGSLPNKSTKQLEHNIDNLSMVVNLQCLRYNTDGTEYALVPSSEPEANSWATNISVNATYVKIKTNENYSVQKAYVTIQYTKTTD